LEAHSVERKLAAIFAADVEGYSRLMGQDEVGTLKTLTAYRGIIDPLIASHRGRIFNTAGDSLVADFASAVDAVQCAVAVQDAIAKENADRTAGEQMRFRIGLHVGDIIVQRDNLFGDAVNVAARLEALAEPGGICVSGTVRDYIGDRLPCSFDDIGEQSVKNIAQPVRAYALRTNAVAASPKPTIPLRPIVPSRNNSLRLVVLMGSFVAAIGIGIAVWWAWPKGHSSAVPVQTSIAMSAQGLPAIEAKSAPRLSIVVLPFSNLSNDAGPFQDCALSRTPSVRPTSSLSPSGVAPMITSRHCASHRFTIFCCSHCRRKSIRWRRPSAKPPVPCSALRSWCF
jgi:class 3 adenylate cyclase